jgi:hypothetical protein
MWWCRASPSWWGASLYSRCAQLQRASTAAQARQRWCNAQARQRRPAADRQAGGRGRPRHSRPRTAGLAPRPAAPVWPADDHGRCGQLWHRGAQAEVAGLRGRGAQACSTADDARFCCGLVLVCRMLAPPPPPHPLADTLRLAREQEKAELQDVFRRKQPPGGAGGAFELPPPEPMQQAPWQQQQQYGGEPSQQWGTDAAQPPSWGAEPWPQAR